MQVNGGKDIDDKVDFAYSLFEQPVSIDAVFGDNEMIDTIAISKGRGTEGVVTRWGVTRLPRKTHRGLRKVTPGFAPGFLQFKLLSVFNQPFVVPHVWGCETSLLKARPYFAYFFNGPLSGQLCF